MLKFGTIHVSLGYFWDGFEETIAIFETPFQVFLNAKFCPKMKTLKSRLALPYLFFLHSKFENLVLYLKSAP